MNKIKSLIYVLVGVTVVLTAGCRNHIQDIDTTMTDYERKVVRNIPLIQLLEKDENNASLRFKLTENRESEIKVYEIHNTISRYTPYQGWRELYEVPMGLCLFPVGICSHVLNVCTLGIFPYKWCWAMDCYGLAALNPFLNNESSTRFEEESTRSRRDLVDTRRESVTYIMHNTSIMFKVGDKITYRLSDAAGIIEMDLLDLRKKSSLLDSSERELRVFVGQSPTPAYSWIIPRKLKGNLMQAKELISAYEKNPTPVNLYKTVIALENLNFTKLSHMLEQRELKKRNKKFAKEFFMAEKKK